MLLTSYEQGLIHGAMYAARPWDADKPVEHDFTTQAEKDFCLFSCPHADCFTACDKCDGKGNLRRNGGRPKKDVDVTEVVALRETMTIAEISNLLSVGKMTIYRAIRSMA